MCNGVWVVVSNLTVSFTKYLVWEISSKWLQRELSRIRITRYCLASTNIFNMRELEYWNNEINYNTLRNSSILNKIWYVVADLLVTYLTRDISSKELFFILPHLNKNFWHQCIPSIEKTDNVPTHITEHDITM